MSDLKALQEKAKAAADKIAAKVKADAETVEQRRLEGEIKLGELDDTLGVRGRDYEAVFSLKTGDMVVMKAPLEVQWQKVQAKTVDGSASLQDALEIVLSCLAYPSPSEFGKVCERTPAIVDDAFGAVSKLAGVREAKQGKK